MVRSVSLKMGNSGSVSNAAVGDERKSIVVSRQRPHLPKQMDAGPFAADVASFRLHLAAENKAEGTIRIYCEAVR